MISVQLEKILQQVHEFALQQSHEFVGLEHLLYKIVQSSSNVRSALHQCGVDLALLEMQLLESIKNNTPTVDNADPEPTIGFERIIQRALIHVRQSSQQEMKPEDVVVAILDEDDSPAAYLLQINGVTRFQFLQHISHQEFNLDLNEIVPTQDETSEDKEQQEQQVDPLTAYTVDLNQEVRAGRIDPLIGRETEMERMLQILCRRRKNNPLLTGEAGVGKTALAEGLAYLIEENKVPEVLAGATVFSLDIGALLAGTKYRGDLEARFKALINALEAHQHAILFIDEIHVIMGAGKSSDSSIDISNLLKPALNKGSFRCVGATTYEEFRTTFSKDHALNRRFQKIDVLEPSIDETVAILQGLKPIFESHHHVQYTDEAFQAAAQLSAKYINQSFLPDKAIDVIDEAGAAERIAPANNRVSQIGKAQIERVIAKIARIPEQSVSQDDKQKLQYLARDLKDKVFGQEQAIDALVAAVKLTRSGLGLPDKPIGCFLFSGPTGVGKTEVAKQLAASLSIPLQRFDMSEYMEAHAVSRLIGAPPGYVGYEQGGLLTEAINKQPHCVLLLDEIEKAHRDIYNVLLQVMDNGKLTDNNGRSADFRNVVLIMTTNAGAEALSRPTFGFTSKHERGDEMQEINKQFSPEFRNRLDAIIPFAPLTLPIIERVVDKFLAQLSEQLLDKNVQAQFGKRLRAYLAKEGFDPQMGARPMNRLIQEKIRKVLADELLFGQLSDGGNVSIDWNEQQQKITLDIRKNETKTRKKETVKMLLEHLKG